MPKKPPAVANSAANANGAPLVHTEATATMLSFANPPSPASDPTSVGNVCAREGFAAIGIIVHDANQIIDFSAIDDGMCATLASSIEICVDAKGYSVPALTGTLQIMQQKGVKITFGNFVAGLAQMMVPKS